MPRHMTPVNFGICGMGGYASAIAERLLSAQALADAPVRLVAACDPAVANMPERAAKLTGAGVAVSDSFDALLARRDIEVVWLPLPIQLHLPFTERALAAGKHVVCEKPAAGTVQDVDAMIAARDRADGRLCLIGFQDVYQPAVLALKRELLSGELGRPVRASVIGCWPRPKSYFRRNNWAGKLKIGDTWVLDSPVNNAMAHYVHVTQFLLGAAEDQGAAPESVEAELYRANDIENYDTCTIRATLSTGVPFTVAMTHACATKHDPVIVIETDRTTMSFQHPDRIVYGTGAGARTVPLLTGVPWHVLGMVARRVRGDATAQVGTLEMARAHTLLVNLASAATPVVPVKGEERTIDEDDPIVVIDGIESVLRECATAGKLLHETGLVSWSRPGKRIDAKGYARFTGPPAG
jgi:predicted dehydrogenase